jgi:hypothetical protein
MSLQFIDNESNGNSLGTLPWVNEYLKQGGTVDDVFPVVSVYPCDTGLLVCCEGFKGFVFKNTNVYTNLLDALNTWIGDLNGVNALFVMPTKQGRIRLAVDNEISGAIWIRNQKAYEQKLGNDMGDGSDTTNSNPFLTPPATSSYETQTTARKRKRDSAPASHPQIAF